MDTMRALNRSLPRSTAPHTTAKPPEALLQSFKEAALSVTKLYKEAATSHQRARQAGYQDALDDLLALLDREDLGLDDGEGWRVRQWATERLDGTSDLRRRDDDSDSDRDPSPTDAAAPEVPASRTHGHAAPNTVPPSSPPPPPAPQPAAPAPALLSDESPLPHQPPAARLRVPPQKQTVPLPQPEAHDVFTFRAEPLPAMDLDAHAPATPARRRRAGRSCARRDGAGPGAALGLGPGSGTKRKLALGDFFDLTDLLDTGGREREREGGGKKGRTS